MGDITGTYLEMALNGGHGDAVACMAGGKLRELKEYISTTGKMQFLTRGDKIGNEIYRRSAVLLFMKAVYDIYGKMEHLSVHFSVSKGYYIEGSDGVAIDDAFIQAVRSRMQELVAADMPIEKRIMSVDDAIELFRQQNMMDKVRLFNYRMSSQIAVYEMDGYFDYFYGYMVPSAGYIKYFELYPYADGVVLQLPTREEPDKVPEFKPQDKVTLELIRTTRWCAAQSARNVADLNDAIVNKSIDDLILIQETEMNQRLAEIASEIKSRGNVKFVMIAGPSSSGKTSFSYRLSIQLRAQGYRPHPIGVDDYYKERELCPKDENGEYNYEDLEAIDVELFNRNMNRLLEGEEIEMPRFNFKTGHREYKGEYMKLGDEDILIIEGIHCLNPALYPDLPADRMYKVYISALTQLNVDDHNRVATTDGRLLRRMARDAAGRGISAADTLARWESVRRGEEKNIFPYQETADVVFNSALCYELPVLKAYAEPLLFSVPKDSPEYQEAKRLLKFLSYFLTFPRENIPHDSILREFVGGSVFPV